MTVDVGQDTSWEVTGGFVSSNIAEFRYDRSTDTLQVDFQDGSTYELYNVPSQTHRMFQAAGSKGEYYARHLKGRFAYEKVA